MKKKILVTGTAGFIGYHLTERLLQDTSFQVYGLDNINDYYDVNLKYDRLQNLGIEKNKIEYNRLIKGKNNLSFTRLDLEDRDAVIAHFKENDFDTVIHLAAQAGVRYSLENPHAYLKSNMDGFLNILEGARHHKIEHLIYASSSSVYGLNQSLPFNVKDNVDHPISLYAATKKANELMAHTYAYLYGLPSSGLRFFTVYGPWGRPDMALFIFTDKILKGEKIDVYNHGNMQRDFTYVDDIVESVYRLIPNKPKGNPDFDRKKPDPASSPAPYQIYNIGNNAPVKLMDFVHAIEKATGKKAEINYMPLQAGDVPETYADVQSLFDVTAFKPNTAIEKGIDNFVNWYLSYYKG